MEGRFSKSLLYVLTNCKDPSQDAQFNEWYNHTHLPDVLNSGLVRDPIRFVKATDSPDDQQPRYLATYESDSDDPARLMDEVTKMAVRLDELGRVHSAIEVAFVGMLRRIKGGYWSRSCNRKVNGVMAVFTNCSDPSREEEFNFWYNDIHLSDILSTGGFHTDYRYEDISPQTDRGKYLALYESEIDPLMAEEMMDAQREWFVQNNRRTDLSHPVSRTVYRRIYPPV